MASSGQGFVDEDGEFSDWIELRNISGAEINLQEWQLTDDPNALRKWEFPSVILPANGYLVVFASGKNRNEPKLHTNFSLDAEGEFLALVSPDGTVVSSFPNGFPEQQRNFSYGLNASGDIYVFYQAPTPGAANSGVITDFVKDTKFNYHRGFYDIPFDLIISTETPGATIRYTTNGIPPSATTGNVYGGPIPIRSSTVIRAAAFKTGLQPSNVDTHTYIFLDDVLLQSWNGKAPPGWPTSWGANVVDYGMDPQVVTNAVYRNTIKNDLKTIPSFSIVMRLTDLFSSSTGIYANPYNDGRDWERACSLELIYPDGREGFQIDAGIRIRGGFSRSTDNPKHAFRFLFRESYGAGKLNYPVFGENAASSFDGFDLRTFQNFSWSFGGDANGVFLRDQHSRDTQLELGHNAERGDYYHLYINGQYWGLYNSCERPEASYAASYFGGEKEDYDVIKVSAGPYDIYATDGTMAAWTQLYNMAKAGFATDAAYQKVQGNNPDGTPNSAYPVLVDIPNLIDYMLVILYNGNRDAPISEFLGNVQPNNWYGVRNRRMEARQGFKFFVHDAEHTLYHWEPTVNRIGPFTAGDTSVLESSPQWVWQKLWAHPEFRLKVADHAHRHFFNGGSMTTEKARQRFNRRKAEIDRAVVGESARWGDAKRTTPLTRNDWVNAINAILNNWFPNRTQTVINQLKSKNLYPNIAAPSFNQHGGFVNPGFQLTMSAPAGTIYYTLDGSDPRLRGGAVSPAARPYSGPIRLDEPLTAKARVLSGTTWSALNEAVFSLIRTYKELRISEIMYHPSPEGNIDGDEFEFIEFKNIGTTELDLSGVQLTNGISFRFPNGSYLAPGAFAVLVKNPVQFSIRYPNVKIAGVYTNNLANSGETIALVHAAGAPIQIFQYNDSSPWPASADGTGFSLVPTRFDPNADYNLATYWRASARVGGSPGQDDPPSNIVPVLINEILTHPPAQQKAAIEFHNPNAVEAPIGGWFLSDDPNAPKKYKIPPGTVIPPNGYVVLDEDHFNPSGNPLAFTFRSSGGAVYLFSADESENLNGYIQSITYEVAAQGISFGRFVNSVSEVSFPSQNIVTLGLPNSDPKIGPVIINEIRYRPAIGDEEFIELVNISGSPVKLYDPANAERTWKMDGLNFSFPPNIEVPPGGFVVVCTSDPNSFRSRNGVPVSTQVFGPAPGILQDDGEMLRLLQPEPSGGLTSYITIDSVRYSNKVPWPTGANGTGPSIERTQLLAFGNDPASWRASPGPASPGRDNYGNRPPKSNAGPDISVVTGFFPFRTNLVGTALDDGLPNPPATLAYTWSNVSGPGEVLIENPSAANTAFNFPGVGLYTVRLTVSDGEYSSNDEMVVSITRPPLQQIIIPTGSTWSYLDDGSNQGSLWRERVFNDSSWPTGKAQLGYGDGDEAKVIGFGPNESAKYITTYFRRKFNISSARSVLSLNIRLLRDDGAVVYINGKEVLRSNMPTGAIAHLTLAANVVGGGDENAFYESPVDPSVLIEGENVIAVEVHQQNAGSSDISFDLELNGLASGVNKPPTANAGPDLEVKLPAVAQLTGGASDDGLPNPPGVFSATWAKMTGPGEVNFENANSLRTTASFTTPGTYQLRLSVTDGELTALDDVQISVTGGTPYELWLGVYFTSAELQNASISGDSADPDHDGFSNSQEFIAGTHPRDPSSCLKVEKLLMEGNDFVIRFEAIAERSYAIQFRDSVAAGAWETLLDLSPQANTQPMEVLDSRPTQLNKFYRIVTPSPLELP